MRSDDLRKSRLSEWLPAKVQPFSWHHLPVVGPLCPPKQTLTNFSSEDRRGSQVAVEHPRMDFIG